MNYINGTTVILDNYDSFTFNLFQQVAELQAGQEPLVFRNDAISFWDLQDLGPERVIISPGSYGSGFGCVFGSFEHDRGLRWTSCSGQGTPARQDQPNPP